MADPNPALKMYRPGAQGAGMGEPSVAPRCEKRNWRGELCVLTIHEGDCIFPAPHPRLRDALSYWWLWLVDEFHELRREMKNRRTARCS